VLAVLAEVSLEPLPTENDPEHFGQRGVVIDDENSTLHG